MYDFIRTIFYEFRQAVPLALIGFAAGVMILAVVNWKYRRPERVSQKVKP